MANITEHWVKTADAVKILGITRDSLVRRYANPSTGFLKEGKHYKNGMYFNSSKTWDIIACKDALLKQGYVFTNST